MDAFRFDCAVLAEQAEALSRIANRLSSLASQLAWAPRTLTVHPKGGNVFHQTVSDCQAALSELARRIRKAHNALSDIAGRYDDAERAAKLRMEWLADALCASAQSAPLSKISMAVTHGRELVLEPWLFLLLQNP